MIKKNNNKWIKMIDPTEWAKWIYGKWFVGHSSFGLTAVLVASFLVVAIIVTFIWLRGVDKYNQELAAIRQTRTHVQVKPLDDQSSISDKEEGPIAIKIKGGKNIKIYDNKIKGFRTGIDVEDSENVDTQRNKIEK